MVATRPISTVTPARRSGGNRMKEVGEHRRDHGAADEALQRAEHDHRVEARWRGRSAMLMSVKPTAEMTNRMRVDIRRDR